MTYQEMYDKIIAGEIILPIEVTVIKPICEEFELDEGCKAKIIRFTKSDDREWFQVTFDFSEYETYNKQFWKHDYYDQDGNSTLALYELKSYQKMNCKCDSYMDFGAIVEENFILQLKKFSFENMTPSDIIMNNARLDEMSVIDKDKYILALSKKLNLLHKNVIVFEEQGMKDISALLRYILNY